MYHIILLESVTKSFPNCCETAFPWFCVLVEKCHNLMSFYICISYLLQQNYSLPPDSVAQNSNHLFRRHFCHAVLPFLAGLSGASVISYWFAWGELTGLRRPQLGWLISAPWGLSASSRLGWFRVVVSSGEQCKTNSQGLQWVRLNSHRVTSTAKSQGQPRYQGWRKRPHLLRGGALSIMGSMAT